MASKATGNYGHWGTHASSAALPNMAGAPVQAATLSVGDIAVAGDIVYVCTNATLGGAAWADVGGGAQLAARAFVRDETPAFTVAPAATVPIIDGADQVQLVGFTYDAGTKALTYTQTASGLFRITAYAEYAVDTGAGSDGFVQRILIGGSPELTTSTASGGLSGNAETTLISELIWTLAQGDTILADVVTAGPNDLLVAGGTLRIEPF